MSSTERLNPAETAAPKKACSGACKNGHPCSSAKPAPVRIVSFDADKKEFAGAPPVKADAPDAK